ncbi:S-adenosyl-L-methionine-dependent methyltransferase [Xylariaceae sp. FL0662B]|nr:S-adenosyl-L-methionine-dependent methyltransferase [Xylariaceae sp. FL0662B]
MPRLPPSLLRHAHHISPYLATLLPVCRDLRSAQNELRWLREHAVSSSRSPSSPSSSTSPLKIRTLLTRLCAQRARGTPLQYVLGSQPFGALDIRCRRGVLIPRPETEAWALHLARCLPSLLAPPPEMSGEQSTGIIGERGRGRGIRVVVDFCAGSGCVALLLYERLRRRYPGLRVRGFDVNEGAVALARENVRVNAARLGLRGVDVEGEEEGEGKCGGVDVGGQIKFERADMFAANWIPRLRRDAVGDADGDVGIGVGEIDVLVANPPYVSARGFDRDTQRAVRNHEPRLALVPAPAPEIRAQFPDCRPEDVFYARLLEIAGLLRPGVAVFEVGDLAQAVRVVEMAVAKGRPWDEVEIWRDWPDLIPHKDEESTAQVGHRSVPIRGSGNGRVVFLRRID